MDAIYIRQTGVFILTAAFATFWLLYIPVFFQPKHNKSNNYDEDTSLTFVNNEHSINSLSQKYRII